MAAEVEAKLEAEEMVATTMQMVESGGGVEAHPYAFHVSGPRNLSSPNWRDIINSSWFVSSFFPSYLYFLTFDFLFLFLWWIGKGSEVDRI